MKVFVPSYKSRRRFMMACATYRSCHAAFLWAPFRVAFLGKV